jgi:SAM-dependent methyltransferase
MRPLLTNGRDIALALESSPFKPFAHPGFCPICETEVLFEVREAWLRDNYLCSVCGSIPRERAIARVFRTLFPAPAALVVHESSPAPRGFSPWLRTRCPGLVQSQYWGNEPPGALREGFRNENLESLTFADTSVDVHVTQDVLEHVLDLEQVTRELFRTLRPGGAHVFTTPLVNKERPTFTRATRRAGRVEHLAPEVFHGNPISESGSLVIFDFGYDLVERLDAAAPFRTTIWIVDDLWQGIRAEFNEVLVSRRPNAT